MAAYARGMDVHMAACLGLAVDRGLLAWQLLFPEPADRGTANVSLANFLGCPP